MKIEILHADGSTEIAKTPLTLKSGDTITIDGKISDMDSFQLGDNNLIIILNKY